MALTFVTTDGTLVIPGAPASWETAPNNSGVSTTGVVVLVGEADVGPDFSSETDLTQNFFGPRQFAAVAAKYGSGHLVEAFKAVTAPSLDAGVRGSPSAVYLVKTNKGVKAAGSLSGYGVLQATKEGSLGNLIGAEVVEKTAQVLPTVSAAYVLDSLSETIKVAADGAVPYTLPTTPGWTTPALAATGFNEYVSGITNQSFAKNIMISGGAVHQPCNGLTGNISLAASDTTVTITLATAVWAYTPIVGQTLIIPTGGGPLVGAGNANEGFYVVLSATTNTVVAKKLKNLSGAAPTSPVAVAPTGVTSTAFQTYDKITFTGAKGEFRSDQAGLTTWSGAVSGSNFVITLTTGGQNWTVTPKAGDLAKFFRTTRWWFRVVSATSNTVTLTQIAPSPAVMAVTGFASEAVGSTTLEFINPVVDGLGQTLLFWRDSASTGKQFYGDDASPHAISTAGAIYVSAAEEKMSLKTSRAADNISETWSAGGDIVLTIGKDTTVAQPISISGYTMTLGTDAVIDLRKYRTIGDLAAYINSLTSWHATATASFKQFSPDTVIDHLALTAVDAQNEASATNQGLLGAMPCRIKKDAYDMMAAVAGSRLVEFAPTLPVSGLPEAQSISFLVNGAKGDTTNADVQAALDAAGLTRCNFVVPLFSQDAIDDIAAGETESTSTYDIASVNAALSDHVVRFSQFKARKPRQGFPSYRGTFQNSKLAAQTLANFRLAGVNFLDVNALGTNGLQWFQPWMGAVIEAGMQAAGFYRPLFNKSINISGVRSNGGDFSPADDDAVEDCLLNGLTVIRSREGGGFSFVKDNTTYGVDNNFVFNSVQAIYVADLVAQTTSLRMERAFVGQSFADVSPTVAMSFFKNIMANLKSLKLITASSDAPSGYKNVIIDIQAPAMMVSAEIKLATGVYFVPIKFLVTQVQGTATA